MVFEVGICRDKGVSWLLSALDCESGPEPNSAIESTDWVKLKWVSKGELTKEEKAAIAASGFKAKGRGLIWTQFCSSKPDWHPWHIDALEVRQLVSDLGQLTAIFRLLKAHPFLFEDRSLSEISFLRAGVPSRSW